jgi:hypothetical protein
MTRIKGTNPGQVAEAQEEDIEAYKEPGLGRGLLELFS